MILSISVVLTGLLVSALLSVLPILEVPVLGPNQRCYVLDFPSLWQLVVFVWAGSTKRRSVHRSSIVQAMFARVNCGYEIANLHRCGVEHIWFFLKTGLRNGAESLAETDA